MLENYIDLLTAKSGRLQGEIDTGIENNSKKEELLQEYYSISQKYGTLDSYYDKLFLMRKSVMSIMDEYRNTVIRNLELRVQSILAAIFPEENFLVKITYTPNRGHYNSEVYIGKEGPGGKVTWAHPKTANGGFMKQLISFSIIASINVLLHSNFLFMDEPFSSSDYVNTSKLKPVFNLMLDEGLQLMFIEHKKEMYEHIDHRLIRLYKHRSANSSNEGYVEMVSAERIYADVTDEDITDSGLSGELFVSERTSNHD